MSRQSFQKRICLRWVCGFCLIGLVWLMVSTIQLNQRLQDRVCLECNVESSTKPEHLPTNLEPTTDINTVQDYPYTIVTAASANHLCALENFLYKLNHHRSRFANKGFPRIVVYNLGMNRTQLPVLDQLQANGKLDVLVQFDFLAYPHFWDVAMRRGEYAWKTAIVDEMRVRFGGIVVWLDAGNVVTADFVRMIPGIVRRQRGFWSPRSQHTAKIWTHPRMFEYFEVSAENYENVENCNGAALGFDTSDPNIVNGLILPWLACAKARECIAPPGSSRLNHRQDQAAITLLAHHQGHVCTKPASAFRLQLHRDTSCRSDLLGLDLQHRLFHPSSIDLPPWRASDTVRLYHHPEWRYPQDNVPSAIKQLILEGP
ncbi:hypothetical protein J3Q64DRAFT_1056956 [Phycomyces blakesleeanus]|uniref:Uncharacterized protein n=2 Tax=Phycomyces blakesleeanus TaxID=4837 RepID=A0A167K1Y3_PHYB8|nr:hypothetical protein PHYBLDRAFT_151690 [Phycomyces blakesleeanus NRRL 1555(-)]OAD67089.1 hypothetical protein PHYBLDRAFT_151690 [Phycomyces blakesleeanus NRRL 1555(-)]|eukprot:XP_018285129.1 hypothetical protein PHYBLDRAFT_151690 [Phycomyces blakesleeanus NRRL 1555(-)]